MARPLDLASERFAIPEINSSIPANPADIPLTIRERVSPFKDFVWVLDYHYLF
jgi:hypothetical protein